MPELKCLFEFTLLIELLAPKVVFVHVLTIQAQLSLAKFFVAPERPMYTAASMSPEEAPQSKPKKKLIENEPYLGPAWAVLMLLLYFLKEAFPAEHFTLLWWFEVYVLGVVLFLTLFVGYRRYKYFKRLKNED